MPIFGDHDPRINTLRKVPIFSRCSDRELRFIASKMDHVTADAGQVLITQGELNHAFNIVLSGAAEIHVDGETVKVLAAGDFFGEISMIDLGPAVATVVATAPSELGVMSHQQFRDAIKGNDELYQAVMAVVGERLRSIGREDRLTH
jgi:CRP-like cAMP-binding protein